MAIPRVPFGLAFHRRTNRSRKMRCVTKAPKNPSDPVPLMDGVPRSIDLYVAFSPPIILVSNRHRHAHKCPAHGLPST